MTNIYHTLENLNTKEPYTLGDNVVRQLARTVADNIISEARTLHGPVVWITGNSYMPPLRSMPEAELVYQSEDDDAWPLFVELVDDHLAAADVALECPEWDNALYAVDLKRWQYKDTDQPYESWDGPELGDEWEPRDDGDGIGWNDHLTK